MAVTADEVARIASYPWWRQGLRFLFGFTRRRTNAEGEREHELKRTGDACIFLSADGLCLIEQKMGREFKPRVCRKFPFVFAATTAGAHVAVSPECQSRWRSLAAGPAVAEQRDELFALLRESRPFPTKWRYELVPGGGFLRYPEVAGLQEDLGAALVALDTLAEMPAVMAELLWRHGARFDRSEASAEALDAAFAALHRAVEAGIQRHETSGFDLVWLQLVPGAYRAWGNTGGLHFDGAISRFLLAVARGRIEDDQVLVRAPTVIDGLGKLVLETALVSVLARALRGQPGSESRPPVADANLAYREVSLFLRSAGGETLQNVATWEGLRRLICAAPRR